MLYIFETNDTTYKHLSNRVCSISRQLDDTEVDIEVGVMYEIYFADVGENGCSVHAFSDELTPVSGVD